jgi:hypothetical protein
MHKRMFVALGLIAGLGAIHVHADELEMVDPPAARTTTAGPTRGSSMAQVERQFGEPTQRYGAVGEPPITRWVYPQFVVYFEHSHVIHAVAKRATPSS